MPVKLGGKLPTENAEARIEIVPLIDIMFFLLASFMLVSLSMVHANTVKVNLPTASTGSADAMKDVISISIDRAGQAFLDKQPMTDPQIRQQLLQRRLAKPATRVMINADNDTRHGDVIRILDLVRAAGIDKVGFDVKAKSK